MKLMLTGINFNYANGYNSDYTSVNLNFNNFGSTFNLSGYIEITNEEYATASGDITKITDLIKQKIIDNINNSSQS